MPSLLQPVSGVRSVSPYQKLYANPHFDYLTEMLPKDVKELFRWCEVVYNSMPTIANAIRKLINYPVTEFIVNDPAEKIKQSTLQVLKDLNMHLALLDFGNDMYVYGNAFRTVYLPFVRFLKCPACGQETAISDAKFDVRKKKFILTCSCGNKGQAEIVDRMNKDITKVRIVKWDPKQIELKQNPITGKTVYYYEMPKNIVTGILSGDPTIIEDTPRVFIDAAFEGKNLKMGSNFYHGKMPSLSGYSSGWGISPIMSVLKTYMHIAVLRRAQEAIGLEHITPKTILFPQSSGTSDPSIMSSMARWKQETLAALDRWRFDPNYVMTAPYPTGVVNIGSQGRGLSPTEEIKDTRMEMALALDIPPDLVMGNANINNSAVALRILENQLAPQTHLLEDFMWWVLNIINVEFKREYAKPTLQPFRLADDMMNKQILLNLQGQAVSRATLSKMFSLDAEQERETIKQEQISDAKLQQEIQKALSDEQNDIAAQAQQAEQQQITGQAPQYDQQQILGNAQNIIAQMEGMPFEQRQSYLAQLQNEDYVMWAVVSKQLEFNKSQQRTMAAQQMAQQGGMQ